MTRRMVITVSIPLIVCTSCNEGSDSTSGRGPVEQLEESAVREGERIMAELDKRDYQTVYSRFSAALKQRWPKVSFFSEMSDMRKRVGEDWLPNRRGHLFSVFPGMKCDFAYNLTKDWVSDHTLTFLLTREKDTWTVADLKVSILLPEGSAEAGAIRRTCEGFLSLLAEDRIQEATTVLMEPGGRLLAPLHLKKVGATYRDLLNGAGISYKFHRLIGGGIRQVRASVMEKQSGVVRFQVEFKAVEGNGFKVQGVIWGTAVRD